MLNKKGGHFEPALKYITMNNTCTIFLLMMYSNASVGMGQPTPKHPRSTANYQIYQHILPSPRLWPRVLRREKHILAIQSERKRSPIK